MITAPTQLEYFLMLQICSSFLLNNEILIFCETIGLSPVVAINPVIAQISFTAKGLNKNEKQTGGSMILCKICALCGRKEKRVSLVNSSDTVIITKKLHGNKR